MYWLSSAVSAPAPRLRRLSKNSFNAGRLGGFFPRISARTRSRKGLLLGEERSAEYPAALIAAITANKVGLPSSCPCSGGAAMAEKAIANMAERTNLFKDLRLG